MGRWGVNSVNNLHLQRIHSWPPRYRAPLPADAGGPFVNGAEKANGRPTLGQPIAGASLMTPALSRSTAC